MKKIDLHLHTISTISDREFEFSLETLKKYVNESGLDVIGISNHNYFDKDNYDFIVQNLDAFVLPGVEVNIEGCHILVYSSNEAVDAFNEQCRVLQERIIASKNEISFEEFMTIFDTYQEYIVIPHYENKKPAINKQLLTKFGSSIKTGEVSNPKRWNKCMKDPNMLVPVIFSDFRVEKDINVFPNGLTFLDIDDISFNNIRLALSDKKRVLIDPNNTENEFIIHGNVSASSRLNLIVGRRSTGKTHLLDSVEKSYPDSKIRYIKQFAIVNKAEKKKFNELITKENHETTSSYLTEIGNLIKEYSSIDDLNNKRFINQYVDTLKKYAEDRNLEDIYSSSALFNSSLYENISSKNIRDVIKALRYLIDNDEFQQTIQEHLSKDKMLDLLKQLLFQQKSIEISNKCKNLSNEVISLIKGKLNINSSRTQISVLNIVEISADIARKKYFDLIMNKLLVNENLDELEKRHGRFKRKVTKRKYRNAKDLKDNTDFGRNPVKEILDEHYIPGHYYDYLYNLKKMSEDLVKPEYFICTEYDLKNEKGDSVSGGERAEYLLSKEINEASKYDFLLIDEPEASFDNIFLGDSIKEMIKQISETTTTFVTTHNNSLGAELRPDKLLYTDFKEGKYTVYAGKFGAENLVNEDGKEIPCSEVIYDTLESGKDKYENRRTIYESLEN